MNTAQIIHEHLASLGAAQLCHMERIAIDLGSCRWLSGHEAAGCCVHPEEPEVFEPYEQSLSPGHPVHDALAAERLFDAILVVDHDATATGGSREVFLAALHEFAHALRRALARAYPTPRDQLKISNYLQGRQNALSGRKDAEAREERRMLSELPFFDVVDEAPDFERAYGLKGGPGMFGRWATRTEQFDPGGHDLLFYLLLYVLEREADDAGLFAREVPLSPSAFVPEQPRFDDDEGSQADGEG